MKWEEVTEFLIEWGDNQQLLITEGIAVAARVLAAVPLPVQVGVRCTTYMALGERLPPEWLRLFDNAAGPAPVQADIDYVSRIPGGFLTQSFSLSPCEQGEHMHASVVLLQTIQVPDEVSADALQAALYEAWRAVGDQMSDLQDEWVHPCLDHALELEELHGGQG